MRKLFPIGVFFLSFNLFIKAADIKAGIVWGRWQKTESPYHILGSVKIPEGRSLIIEPGVVIEFQGSYKITAKGNITAKGTSENPILFSVHDTAKFFNGSLTNGGWQGILITGSGTSVLRYCQFKYVRNNNYLGAAIAAKGGSLIINNCSFSYNNSHRGGAISCFETNLTIDSSFFQSNSSKMSGGALYSENSCCHIKNNIFVGNESRFGGAISIVNASSIILKNNDIKNNFYTEYGGGIYLLGSSGTIDSNRILNNFYDYSGGSYNRYGSAIYAECCDLQLKNNHINDNTGSGSVYYKLTNGTIIKNNICRNYSESGCGGIILFRSNPYIFSNVLYGNNGSQLYLLDVTSQPTVELCKIEKGVSGVKTLNYFSFHGKFENNISLDSYEFSDSENALSLNHVENEFEKTHSSPFSPDVVSPNLESMTAQGIIAQDTYWNADTITITGNIRVEENVKLFIKSGIFVKNPGSFSIDVEGTLTVEGTKKKSFKLYPSGNEINFNKDFATFNK